MNYAVVRNRKAEIIKALELENSKLKQLLIEKELQLIELARELEKVQENAKSRKQA
jgi:hypothetical protein